MTTPIAMHDRIAYSAMPERAPVQWPGGARLALWIAPNIEHYQLDMAKPVTAFCSQPRMRSATHSDSLPLWVRVGVGAREAPPVRHACPSPQRGEGASPDCTDSHLTP